MNRWFPGKLTALVLIALALAWALSLIEGKINERANTRDEVVHSIANQFATDQVLDGPLLQIHCVTQSTEKVVDASSHERMVTTERDCSQTLRPKVLEVDGSLDVTERYRGIYKARVYAAKMRLKATLPEWTPPPGAQVKASIVLAVTDPRGIKQVEAQLDDTPLEALPGSLNNDTQGGFHIDVAPERLKTPHNLQVRLDIAGTSSLFFRPLAEQNEIVLQSAWPHPSFQGKFLPDQRSVDGNGFKATWHVNDFATGGASQKDSNFGVSLIDPINAYSLSMRAVVYGFLFVVLTLGGFFVFEKLQGDRLHPMQYLLIGLAVVIFFLLLLALSEHMAFKWAYLIAAAACMLMISSYSRVLMRSTRLASVVAISYGLLYAGLYLMLQSEDYALLLGAWLIFSLLGITMYLTRKVDWMQTTAPQDLSPTCQSEPA